MREKVSQKIKNKNNCPSLHALAFMNPAHNWRAIE